MTMEVQTVNSLLKPTKPYQIWSTPLHVSVAGINRREYKRNYYIIR